MDQARLTYLIKKHLGDAYVSHTANKIASDDDSDVHEIVIVYDGEKNDLSTRHNDGCNSVSLASRAWMPEVQVTPCPILQRNQIKREKLLSAQLIRTARDRCEVVPHISEADLRRATSDIYYAMFHALAETLVAHISSDKMDNATREVYENLYRIPDHQHVNKRCREITKHSFSDALQKFAAFFPTLQSKRHNADYNPRARFERSNVMKDIQIVEDLLDEFRENDPQERVRFAYFLCLKTTRT